MQKLAIVTGGAQGIGLAVTIRLTKEGWRVAALDMDSEALEELRGVAPDDHVLAVECDVANEREVLSAFEQIRLWQEDSDQPEGIDLLVSNAGKADPVCGPIEHVSLAKWHSWIEGHLTGAFLMARGATPGLRARAGSIVLMSSTRALQSEPDTFAYSAAKGGLCALAHSLAISLGPDIRVNTILPGWVETSGWQKRSQREEHLLSTRAHHQHPAGRVGMPEDIAGTVMFLASDDADFLTGQQIVIDGGMTRKMIYTS